jgi:hypothetical protein
LEWAATARNSRHRQRPPPPPHHLPVSPPTPPVPGTCPVPNSRHRAARELRYAVPPGDRNAEEDYEVVGVEVVVEDALPLGVGRHRLCRWWASSLRWEMRRRRQADLGSGDRRRVGRRDVGSGGRPADAASTINTSNLSNEKLRRPNMGGQPPPVAERASRRCRGSVPASWSDSCGSGSACRGRTSLRIRPAPTRRSRIRTLTRGSRPSAISLEQARAAAVRAAERRAPPLHGVERALSGRRRPRPRACRRAGARTATRQPTR